MHFREWNFCILIKISQTFVPKGHIGNNIALVQIVAWRRIGDKPLSEPMLTWFADAYVRGDEYSVNMEGVCDYSVSIT